VRLWLDALPRRQPLQASIDERTRELIALGFKGFDAIHVASAELLGAAAMCTCDDRLLAASRRHASLLKVRIVNPIDLAQEILQ
jgi:predicted nucleic acid-binding protein